MARRGGIKQNLAASAASSSSGPPPRSRSPAVVSKGGARAHAVRTGQCLDRDEAEAVTGEEEDNSILAFRHHISKLFLKNKCSGLEAQGLCESAHLSGAAGVDDLASAGASGQHPKNIIRDLMRRLLKGSSCPKPYWAKIPCKSPATGEPKVMTWLPFLLVHEWLHHIIEAVGNTFKDLVTFPAGSGLADFQQKFYARHPHIPSGKSVPVGIHGDGVPHQKSKTVEVFTWILPTMPRTERHLFCLVEKQYLCGCG